MDNSILQLKRELRLSFERSNFPEYEIYKGKRVVNIRKYTFSSYINHSSQDRIYNSIIGVGDE